MKKYSKFCFLIVFIILLCSCSNSPSAEKVTTMFFKAVQENEIEQAASYMTFTEPETEEVVISKDDFIQWYKENSSQKGYKLHKFKLLKTETYKNFKRIYVITYEEWSSKNAENTLYLCTLVRENKKWKLKDPSNVAGDIPPSLYEYFKTPEEFATYKF